MIMRATRFWLALLLGSLLSTQSADAVTPHEETTNLPLAYRFVPGQRLVFTLDYHNDSHADLRRLFEDIRSRGQEQPQMSPMTYAFDISVQGNLTATVLEDLGQQVLLAYTMDNPRVRFMVNGQDASTDAQAVEGDLARDLFVLVTPEGRALSLRFDPNTRDFSKGFARAILSLTQFVLPSKETAHAEQWQTEEDDQSGHFLAQYQAEAKQGERKNKDRSATFRKTRLRYLTVPQKAKPNEIPVRQSIIPDGSLMATFDLAAGHLSTLTGSLSEGTVIGGKEVARAESRIDLTYTKTVTVGSDALAAMRKAHAERALIAEAVPLRSRPSAEESEITIQKSELKGATADSLLADLARTEASPANADETSLYLKFKALVYLQPDVSPRLGALLKTAQPNSPTMRILSGVLGDVGHRQAEQALITAIQARPRDWPALFKLISALGSVPSPTPEAEALIRHSAQHSTIPELKSSAELMLGNMARNLAETEPKRAKAIVESFLQDIKGESSEDRTGQLLLVLGNSGSPLAVPTLAQYLKSTSPSLRATAASALRLIDDPQVDALLAGILLSDSDGKVRAEAATALGFREPTEATVQAQKKALLSDKSANIRLRVLRNLWNAHEAFQEIKGLIKQAASQDPAKEVRKAAREIMAQNPNDFPEVRQEMPSAPETTALQTPKKSKKAGFKGSDPFLSAPRTCCYLPLSMVPNSRTSHLQERPRLRHDDRKVLHHRVWIIHIRTSVDRFQAENHGEKALRSDHSTKGSAKKT
jgi:HEAT repeat protein